ncbi:polysaccharide biosynthesis/export family protein [Phaeocystidibacter luteus]|uniref:Sugar transporter n=1 Tax=Phaeocystidibacter luteus TaxID=911197 RepID=A0A6N6RK56_9FLAO|nr:polysaccharide biosynthesis/export family protein [Phaeocystidibacter luteus]KAB2814311.1 sugar transporter [Phaeocystidibacter luteus]
MPELRASEAPKKWGFLRFLPAIILLGLFTTSCIPQKDLTYLQVPEGQEGDSLFYEIQRQKYFIQENDILNVTVRSFEERTANAFNSSRVSNVQNAGDGYFYLTGYTVSSDGVIDLPVVGNVLVEGMTVEEAKFAIKAKLLLYFQDEAISVNVQLSGIRFSVIGEVIRPGKYTIYQNQANIFEALAIAGGSTIYGKRKSVQIIRQYPEGVRVFDLDLTDVEVLEHPDYLVQPNDIINVKPLPQRSWGFGETGISTFIQTLSIISSILLIAVSIRNLSN